MTKHLAEQQNLRFYDEEAKNYDATRYSGRAGRRLDLFHKRLLQEILFHQLKSDAQVLELGCGTGRLLSHFSAGHSCLVGIDTSTGMLRVGRKLHPELRSLVQGNALSLPFANDSLDAVYSILVLNLLPDYPAALAELGRVLRPGGLLLFNLPNLASLYFPGGMYVNLRGRTTGRNQAGFRYSRWYTRRSVASALQSKGFQLTQVWGQPPQVTLRDDVAPWRGTLTNTLACKSLYYLATKIKT